MLFNKFDSDGDGYFTYDDFVQMAGDKRSTFLNAYTGGKKAVKKDFAKTQN